MTPHLVAVVILIAVIGVVSVVEQNFGAEQITGDVVIADHQDTYGKERYEWGRYTNVERREKHTGEVCAVCVKGEVTEREPQIHFVTCDGEYQVRTPLVEDETDIVYLNVNGEIFTTVVGELLTLEDGTNFRVTDVASRGISNKVSFEVGALTTPGVIEEKMSSDYETCKGDYHIVLHSVNYDPYMQAIILVNDKQYVIHPGEKIAVDHKGVMNIIHIEKDKTKPFGTVVFGLE